MPTRGRCSSASFASPSPSAWPSTPRSRSRRCSSSSGGTRSCSHWPCSCRVRIAKSVGIFAFGNQFECFALVFFPRLLPCVPDGLHRRLPPGGLPAHRLRISSCVAKVNSLKFSQNSKKIFEFIFFCKYGKTRLFILIRLLRTGSATLRTSWQMQRRRWGSQSEENIF